MSAQPSSIEGGGAKLERSHEAAEGGNHRAGVDDGQPYRVLAIEAVSAPAGCTGRDWFVYRIAQGDNAITGYRRGSRENVSADVETIVSGLNGRRRWSKSKAESKSRGRAAAARARTAAAASRKAAE